MLDVNATNDEMDYTLKNTFVFDKQKSGNFTEDDEIVTIQVAYIALVTTVWLKELKGFFKCKIALYFCSSVVQGVSTDDGHTGRQDEAAVPRLERTSVTSES